MAIDWANLTQVNWDLPVKAMLQKMSISQQAQASANQTSVGMAGVQQNREQAGLQYNAAMAQTNMQGDIAQQRINMEKDQFPQELNIKQQMVDVQKGQLELDKIVKPLALKVQMDTAMATLAAEDKRAAWKNYTDIITKTGIDPGSIGLPVNYNKDAKSFLEYQVKTGAEGINQFVGTNGMTAGTPTASTGDPKLDRQNAAAKYKNDLQSINDLRKDTAQLSAAADQLPSVLQAADDFDANAVGGMGAGAGLAGIAAKIGAKFGSSGSNKAATAAEIIDRFRVSQGLALKTLMPGSMSDSDRDLLLGTSVDINMPKEAFKTKAEYIAAFNSRAVQKRSFAEDYLKTHGTLDGMQDNWDSYMKENPVVDPKSMKAISGGKSDYSPYLGQAQQRPQQRMQIPQNMTIDDLFTQED